MDTNPNTDIKQEAHNQQHTITNIKLEPQNHQKPMFSQSIQSSLITTTNNQFINEPVDNVKTKETKVTK